MRKKSETRRQVILEEATRLFQEVGFQAASMAELCHRLGGSKATLYSYFPSKEELFFEVMFLATEGDFESIHRVLDIQTTDLATTLQQFGVRLLNVLYRPDIVSVRRLALGESARPKLGQMCHERGIQRSKRCLAAFFQAMVGQGRLRSENPEVMAAHWLGLLKSELDDQFFFCLRSDIEDTQLQAVVARAVTVFLGGYRAV